ncbi:MAG TPA: hypothetical protein VD998_01120 [Verrucomicrobiae bacterium]|nr:hypothetical protein [Verrucomicrobiae bacterium]
MVEVRTGSHLDASGCLRYSFSCGEDSQQGDAENWLVAIKCCRWILTHRDQEVVIYNAFCGLAPGTYNPNYVLNRLTEGMTPGQWEMVNHL